VLFFDHDILNVDTAETDDPESEAEAPAYGHTSVLREVSALHWHHQLPDGLREVNKQI